MKTRAPEKSGRSADWFARSISVVSLLLAFYGSWNIYWDRVTKQKHDVFDSYLLGKELWDVGESFVQYPDKQDPTEVTPRFGQVNSIEQATQSARNLSLEPYPSSVLKELFSSGPTPIDPVARNREFEKNIETAANSLSTQIAAKSGIRRRRLSG